MNKIQIGNIVEIKANIVDYNEKLGKVKVRITGYEGDKRSFAERYLWLDYNDINPINKN